VPVLCQFNRGKCERPDARGDARGWRPPWGSGGPFRRCVSAGGLFTGLAGFTVRWRASRARDFVVWGFYLAHGPWRLLVKREHATPNALEHRAELCLRFWGE